MSERVGAKSGGWLREQRPTPALEMDPEFVRLVGLVVQSAQSFQWALNADVRALYRWHQEQVERAREEGMAVPCSVTRADGPYLEVSQRVSLHLLQRSAIGPEELLDLSFKAIKRKVLDALKEAPDA
jgi:hypothetical protein